MTSDQDMEGRLWDYIDGTSPREEREKIRLLLGTDAAWQKKHAELTGFSDLLSSQELDAPSMRFTKNVMEQIALLQVSPASRQYINKNVIRGLTAFFLVLITGFLIYGLAQIHWTDTPTDSMVPKLHLDASRVDWSKGLNNNYVNAFLLINVVLGLFVLDRFLQQNKMNRGQRAEGAGQ